MNKLPLSALALALAALLGACGTNPVSTSLLEQTRSDYQMAQASPKVTRYAPLEMKLAGDALAQANTAANGRESLDAVDKLAYVAKQKIALAREVANQKSAEAEVAEVAKERDRILLEQRTVEANQARANTDQARMETQRALEDTANAQRQAQEAMQHNANLEAQLAAMAAKKTERGYVITLSDVLFGTDMARLNVQGMRTAQQLADILRQNPQRTVLIEGFTDSTGTAAYNQVLSERRANAVNMALQDLGIGRERIAAQGLGEEYPVASNATANDRQLNRRVEIVLSDESGKIAPR